MDPYPAGGIRPATIRPRLRFSRGFGDFDTRCLEVADQFGDLGPGHSPDGGEERDLAAAELPTLAHPVAEQILERPRHHFVGDLRAGVWRVVLEHPRKVVRVTTV